MTKVNLKISITKEYKVVYSVVSKRKILLQSEVTPCITFNSNTIEVSEEHPNTIHFIQNWIENPNDYRTYKIMYQGKEYELLPEVLFAIVVNEFKKKVEREYIIARTKIQLPSDNSKALQRVKISLQAC